MAGPSAVYIDLLTGDVYQHPNGSASIGWVLLGSVNSSGSESQVGDAIATPSDENDFSGLPGGSAPSASTVKVYWAPRDAGSIWVIASGDTKWRVVQKDAI